MALTIRCAGREDLASIIALYGQPAMDGDAVIGLADAEAIYDRMQCYPNYRLYVAERGGQAVGTYALLVMDNLGHGGTPSGVIEDVVVKQDAQGSGIGRAMMEHALDVARAAGCYKVVLSSNLAREAAHAFYASLGFERHGYSFRVRFEGDPKPG